MKQLFTKDEFGTPCPVDPGEVILLSEAEIKSGLDRVRWAENLIKQLPEDHDGRNIWLLNFGQSKEAMAVRTKYAGNNPRAMLVWDMDTKSVRTVSKDREKSDA